MKKRLMYVGIILSIVLVVISLITKYFFLKIAIGGADGPTDIFITGSYSPLFYYVGLICIFVITGLVMLIVQKNKEKTSAKKSTYMVLTIFFTVATFYGSINVILSNGRLNAGYAVTPMVATIVLMMLYKKQ